MLRSGLTASARGCAPLMGIVANAGAAAFGSKATTRFDAASETKARGDFAPANTTSAGSSPTAIVRTTRMVARSTTLTESETWLTTHASPLERARTDTGSTPTATEPRRTGRPAMMLNTSSCPSAVLAASSVWPSGVMSSGCTCGDSKLTNTPVFCPSACVARPAVATSAAKVQVMDAAVDGRRRPTRGKSGQAEEAWLRMVGWRLCMNWSSAPREGAGTPIVSAIAGGDGIRSAWSQKTVRWRETMQTRPRRDRLRPRGRCHRYLPRCLWSPMRSGPAPSPPRPRGHRR